MNRKYLYKRIGLFVIFSFLSVLLFAQNVNDSSGTNLDSIMRSHDKIYVVMAVCVTILVVLFLYLIRIDIKVSKKERTS
jgi:heme export protein D (CcmD)